MPPSNNEPVPITSLDPRQLQGLKERLESDLNLLGANNVQLQKAAGAFSSSNRAIETLAKSKEGGSRSRRLPADPSAPRPR